MVLDGYHGRDLHGMLVRNENISTIEHGDHITIPYAMVLEDEITDTATQSELVVRGISGFSDYGIPEPTDWIAENSRGMILIGEEYLHYDLAEINLPDSPTHITLQTSSETSARFPGTHEEGALVLPGGFVDTQIETQLTSGKWNLSAGIASWEATSTSPVTFSQATPPLPW